MTLKSARLGRAEKLDEQTRQKFALPEKGLIIIQTKNPELREEITAITDNDGIWGYLKSLGDFIETPVEE